MSRQHIQLSLNFPEARDEVLRVSYPDFAIAQTNHCIPRFGSILLAVFAETGVGSAAKVVTSVAE